MIHAVLPSVSSAGMLNGNYYQVDCVCCRCQSVSRDRQADMDDMWMQRGAESKRDKPSNAHKDVT